ncbi:heat shock protein, partial [Thalassiosira pseudonana CCMP1335]
MSNGHANNGSQPVHPLLRSPYAVLNLPDNSRQRSSWSTDTSVDGARRVGEDEIKDAYKQLSRLLHPDKRRPGKERDDAQEVFIELMNAYEILADPVLRQAYDHFGHS